MVIGVSLSEPTQACLVGKCVSTYVRTHIPQMHSCSKYLAIYLQGSAMATTGEWRDELCYLILTCASFDHAVS